MAAVAHQIYRKGNKIKLVTTSTEATAAVAAGYTAGELVDEIPAKVGTTSARPRAALLGAGAMYFDTTLGKPVWVKADLSGFVDATGTSA